MSVSSPHVYDLLQEHEKLLQVTEPSLFKLKEFKEMDTKGITEMCHGVKGVNYLKGKAKVKGTRCFHVCGENNKLLSAVLENTGIATHPDLRNFGTMMFMSGCQDCVEPTHIDGFHNVMVMMQGQKTVYLPKTKGDKPKTKYIKTRPFDDLEKWTKFSIVAGDVLVVPKCWPHYVETVANTVMCSFQSIA